MGCAVNNGWEILEKFKKNFNIEALPEELKYRIDNYILYKIISICSVYVEYRRFLKRKNEEDTFYQIDIDNFLKKFKNSDSHILFKLKQVVNFVKNYDKVWKSFIEKSNKLPIKELSTKLKEIKAENSIIDLLPPPIYDVNFFTKDNIDILGSISSGEKQLIYSVSTILYHIINLNSVDKSDMCKYRYINIILDEIELYFHPEYQRRFISHLLDSIKNLNITNIEAINILFLTHSPFILSDIPKQNVLFLGEGEMENKNTFAGNISMMLSSSFFMKESLIGEFSKRKINQLLEKLNQQKEEYRKEEEDKKKQKKRKYKSKMLMDNTEKLETFKFIELIDEPILKHKLKEMFREVYPDFWKAREKQMNENELKDLAKRYDIEIEIKSEN